MPHSQDGLARLVARSGVADWVVDAFTRFDRADFVPPGARGAYSDRPVGLPHGQTTSQPSLIAQMIDALDVRADDRILEVGTGYGFQTALLTHRSSRVTSIDRIADLAAAARVNLERAGATGAEVFVGDGWQGVVERAPFDRIIVSAAARALPDALADQTVDDGVVVIPIADAVYVYVKRGEALHRARLLTPARFVPLVPGSA
jgi:protein-L-isoaspartate(D-aspartate) O-methyltransferase